mmetsp:Transcript_13635/g.24207  ORF Transcript_13635/g.24207 Transcript_13635/m.24207 type:complete len:216 (+) Transcript_13635:28-675(+)
MADSKSPEDALVAQDLDLEKHLTNSGEQNPRGFPASVFIECVPDFVAKLGCPIETAVGAFNQLHQRYKIYEQTKLQAKTNYKGKIPEIENTLGIVKTLIEKQENGEEIQTTYNVADTVFAHAKADATGTVYLWLGANVMVEYTYAEARALLEENLANAQQKMAETKEDLEFLNAQSITVEVNMARLINYNVKQQQEAKIAEIEAEMKSKGSLTQG